MWRKIWQRLRASLRIKRSALRQFFLIHGLFALAISSLSQRFIFAFIFACPPTSFIQRTVHLEGFTAVRIHYEFYIRMACSASWANCWMMTGELWPAGLRQNYKANGDFIAVPQFRQKNSAISFMSHILLFALERSLNRKLDKTLTGGQRTPKTSVRYRTVKLKRVPGQQNKCGSLAYQTSQKPCEILFCDLQRDF